MFRSAYSSFETCHDLFNMSIRNLSYFLFCALSEMHCLKKFLTIPVYFFKTILSGIVELKDVQFFRKMILKFALVLYFFKSSMTLLVSNLKFHFWKFWKDSLPFKKHAFLWLLVKLDLMNIVLLEPFYIKYTNFVC